MTNFETFTTTYREQLKKAVAEHSDEYMPGIDPDAVADRMAVAFKNGAFNKDGRAIKATCKIIGINQTYKAITEYINGGTK